MERKEDNTYISQYGPALKSYRMKSDIFHLLNYFKNYSTLNSLTNLK